MAKVTVEIATKVAQDMLAEEILANLKGEDSDMNFFQSLKEQEPVLADVFESVINNTISFDPENADLIAKNILYGARIMTKHIAEANRRALNG